MSSSAMNAHDMSSADVLVIGTSPAKKKPSLSLVHPSSRKAPSKKKSSSTTPSLSATPRKRSSSAIKSATASNSTKGSKKKKPRQSADSGNSQLSQSTL